MQAVTLFRNFHYLGQLKSPSESATALIQYWAYPLRGYTHLQTNQPFGLTLLLKTFSGQCPLPKEKLRVMYAMEVSLINILYYTIPTKALLLFHILDRLIFGTIFLR